MIVDVTLPDMVMDAYGEATAPILTDDDIAAMWRRADVVDDQGVKTDLFRLLIEVEKLRGMRHDPTSSILKGLSL